MLTTTDVIIRLLLITVLAGIIGIERQTRHTGAGVRTNILVGIGSTLLMIISISIPSQFPDSASVDPSRIASQIVVGIGFLGAGLIIHTGTHAEQHRVHGITTAATIWVVSAIGMAVGIGYYIPAVVTTALALIVLVVLHGLKKIW